MRLLAVALAYIVSLVLTAVVTFFAVIFVAGPHSDVLPNWLQTPALLLGCALVIAVPALVARRVWRSLSRTPFKTKG